MSGALVGEIGAALESGKITGLTQNERLALVAIAEKCRTDTRQGTVRMAYIEAWLGKSKRTTERTVQGLKNRGLIEVVKRGHNTHGVVRAPVYRLAVLPPPKVAETNQDASATQDGGNADDVLPPNARVLPPNRDVLPPNQPYASAKSAICFRHPGWRP